MTMDLLHFFCVKSFVIYRIELAGKCFEFVENKSIDEIELINHFDWIVEGQVEALLSSSFTLTSYNEWI